jgi:putative peptide zinc metalloprotease protein
LAEGVELIGEQEGSGYRNPPSLARRGDGQMIQLTPLLYQVVCLADGERDYEAIAQDMTRALERGVSADNVRTLVEDKLRPLGILAQADGSSPPLEKPDPLLALRFRRAIIPEHLSLRVASLFKPLFWPPVVVVVLVALVAFDAWLFLDHGVAQSFRQALYQPALLLAVLALVVISAGWHEFGDAAGYAYGGACPGVITRQHTATGRSSQRRAMKV